MAFPFPSGGPPAPSASPVGPRFASPSSDSSLAWAPQFRLAHRTVQGIAQTVETLELHLFQTGAGRILSIQDPGLSLFHRTHPSRWARNFFVARTARCGSASTVQWIGLSPSISCRVGRSSQTRCASACARGSFLSGGGLAHPASFLAMNSLSPPPPLLFPRGTRPGR